MIRLENVSKVYQREKSAATVNALVDVNLTIADGEFVGIVGPSGCGKTTLLNIIGGLDRPTAGKVLHDGEDISLLNQSLLAEFRNKKTGFVFQSYYLEPNFSVMRNIEMPLIISGVGKKEREERVSDLLKELGLSEKLSVPAKQLSGGQMQRVSIARALINNPSILLADEPTGNLDSKSGKEVMEIFREINHRGKTVLLVTHNEEYLEYCTKTVRLADGQIEAVL